MQYLHYDREQLDRQYNVRIGIARFQDIFDRWNAQAKAYRQQHTARTNLHYGMHRLQTLDYFPAEEENAPLLVFVHGGYWRSLDKDGFSHVAAPYLQAGIAVALLNYRLAPEVDMPGIVADVCAGFAWLYRQAATLGFDPQRMHVAGHSAGGHLAAMLASTDWHAFNLPADAVKGLCCISGLYDLEPIRLCYLNETLRLDEPQVAQFSPLHHLPPTTMPVVLTAGGTESAEFHRQMAAYAERLAHAGFSVQRVRLSDGHHLDVIDKFGDRDGELARALVAMIGN
ncbi:alpha/beta hydrolase [Herbaspirillum sp. RV1423]|uniref:alpha/beta hydrolase n=1 Tax=Herbaspirillum sp. RV1423 TaxID=1443993 RepID=UPI0004BB7352|nr:alpha/beta hydrolase [Herbaspirillum sp. RV1423]